MAAMTDSPAIPSKYLVYVAVAGVDRSVDVAVLGVGSSGARHPQFDWRQRTYYSSIIVVVFGAVCVPETNTQKMERGMYVEEEGGGYQEGRNHVCPSRPYCPRWISARRELTCKRTAWESKRSTPCSSAAKKSCLH